MRFRKKYSARANGRQRTFLGNIQLYAAVQIGIQRFKFFFLMFLRHMSVGSLRSGWSKSCKRQTTRSFRIAPLPCPVESDPLSVNYCPVLAYVLAYVAYGKTLSFPLLYYLFKSMHILSHCTLISIYISPFYAYYHNISLCPLI